MSEDLKSILQALVKSPAVWVAAITLLTELQTWLAPDIPASVISAVRLVIVAVAGVLGVSISAYYAGKAAQQRAYQQAAEKNLPNKGVK